MREFLRRVLGSFVEKKNAAKTLRTELTKSGLKWKKINSFDVLCENCCDHVIILMITRTLMKKKGRGVEMKSCYKMRLFFTSADVLKLKC